MAEAASDAEWWRVAWLCLHMPRFGRSRRTLKSFHPWHSDNKELSEPEALMSMRAAADKANLPDHMSEEDIEARWTAFTGSR